MRALRSTVPFVAFLVCTSATALAPYEGRQPPSRAANIPDCTQFAVERQKVVYPREELRRGVQGWVAFTYTLTGNGAASEVRVADSEPRGVFVAAAETAFRQWRCAESVRQEACLQVFEFRVSP